MVTYDKILCRFKSKEVILKHKDKVLKRGIFTDWNCQPFFMEIYIETEKAVERVKLFYPFSCENYGDDIGIVPAELYLDYRISTFNEEIGIDYINNTSKISHHKFLNTIVSLEEV